MCEESPPPPTAEISQDIQVKINLSMRPHTRFFCSLNNVWKIWGRRVQLALLGNRYLNKGGGTCVHMDGCWQIYARGQVTMMETPSSFA